MSDLALLVKLQAQVAIFLADLPVDQLVALAEGRAILTVQNGAAAPSASTSAAAPAPEVYPESAPPELLQAPAVSDAPGASVAREVHTRPAASAAPQVSAAPEMPAARRNGQSAAVPRPRRASPSAAPIDAAAVVAQLRAARTVDEATELLARLKLKVADLKLVAKELHIPTTGNKPDLEKRVLHLTVGARSKHAGLRRG